MDIFEYGSRNASVVLLQPVDEHDLEIIKNEIALIHGSVSQDFRLAAFRVGDWNNDLSPWPAPAVFGREDFGGGAEETLTEIESYCADRTKTYYVGGYSLAGLFAIWAAYRTDLFRGVAAASPSLWFPGFTDYMGGTLSNALTCTSALGTGRRRRATRSWPPWATGYARPAACLRGRVWTARLNGTRGTISGTPTSGRRRRSRG